MPTSRLTPTDAELVRATQGGDLAAFDELVRRHGPRLYRLAHSMMRNSVEAQDAVQDALLNAFRKLDGYRADAAFGSWLHRITANACLMRLRRRRRRPEVSLDLPDERFDATGHWQRHIPDLSVDVERDVVNKELGARILQAIDTLPEIYRVVFVLADLEHLSMAEIAEMLDLSVANTKVRLHRARLKLRRRLEPYLAATPRFSGSST